LQKIKSVADRQDIVRQGIIERRKQEQAEAERMALAAAAAAEESRVLKQKESDELTAKHKQKEEQLRNEAKEKLDALEAQAGQEVDKSWDEAKVSEVTEARHTQIQAIEYELVLFLLDQPTSCF
jgi:hypothetical protein